MAMSHMKNMVSNNLKQKPLTLVVVASAAIIIIIIIIKGASSPALFPFSKMTFRILPQDPEIAQK